VEDWACKRAGINAQARKKTNALQVEREIMSYFLPVASEARYYAEAALLSKTQGLPRVVKAFIIGQVDPSTNFSGYGVY
jgi:hypothetical protein